MGKFIHSVVSQNDSVTAGTTKTFDLPANPLSFILITMRFAQNQANTQLTFANIPAILSKVEVLWKGSAIVSQNGLDLLASSLFLTGYESWGANNDGNDNDLRSLTFMVPMGRIPYHPVEAFPRSTRGELQLQITYASSFSQIDGVSSQIETVELPEATPRQYLKQTTFSITPSATGEFDIELPMGNRISDLTIFGTTIPSGSTATKTVSYVQILVDNMREFYSQINFETLVSMGGLKRAAPGYHGSHVHRLTAGAYAQYDDVSAAIPADHILKNHAWLPFDVLGDGSYMLETRGRSDAVCRISAGDTNAVRVIPAEIVSV